MIMKHNSISKRARILLIAGLLVLSICSLATRYLLLPDIFQGFLMGIGIALEFMALVVSKGYLQQPARDNE